MLIKMFLVLALYTSNTSNPNIGFNYQVECIEPQEERYIIVYKVNGTVHHVILFHPVDCDAIRYLAPLVGVTILDCGSEFGTPYDIIIPEDSKETSEANALSHFGISEWPE